MKGGKTYEEMMASHSPESQKRILEGTERLQEEYLMTRIRRDLGMSQAELAASLGVSQPVISKIEKVRQNIGLFTMKRYIEALGGKLSLQVEMPTGGARLYPI